MRTIKYPLIFDSRRIKVEVTDKIFAEYRKLYGPLNLNDFAEQRLSMSFIDFWLYSLSLGVVFAGSTREILNLAKSISGKSSDSLVELLKSRCPSDLVEKLDFEKVSNFIKFETDRRPPNVGEKLKQDVKDCFWENHKDEPEVERIAALFAEKFYAEKKQEKSFKLSLFNFSISTGDIENQTISLTSNPTFIILPEYPNCTALSLEVIKGFIEEARSKYHLPNKLEDLIGLSSFNAFSNYGNSFVRSLLSDQSNDLDLYLKDQLSLASLSGVDPVRIKQVFSRLKEAAVRLGKPEMAAGWGDYRTEIVGKLSSWFSNSLNYKDELLSDLEKLDKALVCFDSEIVSPLVNSQLDSHKFLLERWNNEVKDHVIQLRESSSRLSELISSGNMAEAKRLFEAVDSRRSLVASRMNELFQKIQGNEENIDSAATQNTEEKKKGKNKEKKAKVADYEEKPTFDKKYSAISKRLRKLGSFFGEETIQLWNKVIVSPGLYKELLAVAEKLSEHALISIPDRILEPKELQQLLNWFRKHFYEPSLIARREILIPILGLDNEFKKMIHENTKRNHRVFYKNVRDRNKFKDVVPDNKQPKISINTLKEVLRIILSEREFQIDLDLDRIEFFKSAFSILLPEDTKFPIRSFLSSVTLRREFFPGIDGYLELLKVDGLDKRELLYFTNTLIFSELRGLINFIGRESFLARAAIQEFNGTQLSLLSSHDIPPTAEMPKAELVALANRARFHVAFKSIKSKGLKKIDNIYQWNDKGTFPPAKLRPGFNKVTASIRSSKYQLQFLKNLIWSPYGKQVRFKTAGSFLIAERHFITEPDWESGRLTIRPLANTERIFVSLPFKPIEPSKKVKDDPLRTDRYIGVDCGEYGFAWSLLEKYNDGVRLLNSGFVTDPQYRSLQKHVFTLRERQKRGTFKMSSTKVARIRKSLIGRVRNQLHALVLRYQAPLVFEWQISAFETGGNKIKKVYNSVKSADCPDNAAEWAENNHLWGKYVKNRPRTGYEVSASATSQCCTKCNRIFRTTLERSKDSVIKICAEYNANGGSSPYLFPEPGTDKIWRLVINQADSNDTIDLNLYFVSRPDKSLKYENIVRAAKDFMRPPVVETAEALQFRKVSIPSNSKKFRGNSAVFLCPYVDCGHVSDCDIQASATIAYKKFIKSEYESGDNGNLTDSIFIEEFQRESVTRLAVPLDPAFLSRENFRNGSYVKRYPQARSTEEASSDKRADFRAAGNF
jgi:hypothetical protein